MKKVKFMLISLIATLVVVLLSYYINIPNPNVVLITVIVFFTFIGGFSSGVVSAVIVLAYSFFFFSSPGKLFQYSSDNLKKMIVIVLFIPILVLLVGILKRTADQKSRKLEEANRRLELMTKVDYLTNIPNRRYFSEFLMTVCKKSAAENLSVSCALIDIDYFKQFNDFYGHLAGDACLQKLSQTMENEIKRSEYFLARFGGEEFVILFPNTGMITAVEFCTKLVEKIKGLRIPHHESTISSDVTVSIGIASMIASRNDSGDTLIERADKALYSAKTKGRNRLEVFTDA